MLRVRWRGARSSARRRQPLRWQSGSHDRRRRWFVAISIAAVIGGFTAGVWGWRIRDVTVEGASVVPNAAVRDAALAMLAERRVAVIPRSSMLLGGTRDIRERLRQQFAFSSVTTDRGFRMGALRIHIVEQAVSAVLLPDGRGFLVGASGHCIGRLPSDGVSFPQGVPIIEGNGCVGGIGDRAMDRETIAFLDRVWKTLDTTATPALRPSRVLWNAESRDAALRTANTATISVTAREHREYQVEKLLQFLASRPLPADQTEVRSVDLRYGNRVYVR